MATNKSKPLPANLQDQRNMFEFLREHLDSGAPFTKEELFAVTTWQASTPKTYWTKQLKEFTVDLRNGSFRVREAFRPYANWKRFRAHVSQKVRVTADYKETPYDQVIVYEFFMPLSNEEALKKTLDGLFYRDTVIGRLKALDGTKLNTNFPRKDAEIDDDYFERIADWVSEIFIGYSIGHVSGRFRVGELVTHAEALAIQKYDDYLVDETTAVTRFIFPVTGNATQVAWFFDALFVQSIIQIVSSEDEIWMVESGISNSLHVWRASEHV